MHVTRPVLSSLLVSIMTSELRVRLNEGSSADLKMHLKFLIASGLLLFCINVSKLGCTLSVTLAEKPTNASSKELKFESSAYRR